MIFFSVLMLKCFTQDVKRSMPAEKSPVKIYLTIDDGPSTASTYINSLAANDSLKINVFLVGDYVHQLEEGKPGTDLYRKNPFIEIGNHSYSHASGHYRLYYRKPSAVLADFIRNNDSLMFQNQVARLPGRNVWRVGTQKRYDLADAKKTADSLAAHGFSVFGWDLEWRTKEEGGTIQTAEYVINRINEMIRQQAEMTAGHIVILCHEVMFTTTYGKEQLASLLQKISKRPGYQLEWLSRYPVASPKIITQSP